MYTELGTFLCEHTYACYHDYLITTMNGANDTAIKNNNYVLVHNDAVILQSHEMPSYVTEFLPSQCYSSETIYDYT